MTHSLPLVSLGTHNALKAETQTVKRFKLRPSGLWTYKTVWTLTGGPESPGFPGFPAAPDIPGDPGGPCKETKTLKVQEIVAQLRICPHIL